MEKNYYSTYYEVERNHWFFLARNKILSNLVKSELAHLSNAKILNVGVATGATSTMLKEFGEVTSIEYDEDCCKFLRDNNIIDVIQGSITELPFEENSFDLVCALDVIEHVQEDQLAVRELSRVCKKNGKVLITVPAFMFLWSDHDVMNQHVKRYTKSELVGLVDEVDELRVNYRTYFNFYLFPFISLFRIMRNVFLPKSDSPKSDFDNYKSGNLSSSIFYKIFVSENRRIKKRNSFPFGVSIMTLCEKI